MARRRFFVNAVTGGVAELRGDEARHLTRVLRVEPGQQFEISDGAEAHLAEIAEAKGERVVFRVVAPLDTPDLPLRVTLCAALIKFDRFEWIIEKATELGVERIVPVDCARSEKGLLAASVKRAERWRKIARESGQQSRRLRAPEIAPGIRFSEALQIEADFRYFLEESTAPPVIRMMPAYRTRGARVAFLVGPEGGWTDAERHDAALWQPVSLGTQILRAETAALAAVAVLSAAWTE